MLTHRMRASFLLRVAARGRAAAVASRRAIRARWRWPGEGAAGDGAREQTRRVALSEVEGTPAQGPQGGQW